MLVFEEPQMIKVFYEPENGLLFHEWLRYPSSDEVAMSILRKLYEIFLKYRSVEKIIVKTDKTTGVFSQKIQEYIDTVQFPNMIANTKLRYIVIIVPQNALSKLATTQWQQALKKGERVIIHNVKTEAEARTWLQQFK